MAAGIPVRSWIAHHVPGRLRLRFERGTNVAEAARRLEGVLADTAGLNRIEAHAASRSVVITYNPRGLDLESLLEERLPMAGIAPQKAKTKKSSEGAEGSTLSGRAVLRQFATVLLRTPKYAMLTANLARDRRVSAVQKAGAGASLGYALLPFDLLPGIIPVIGQLDDLTVMIGGLRAILRRCPPEVASEHLARAGLSFESMDADLATVRDTAFWLGRQGAGLVGQAVQAPARVVRRLR